jgi:outer membrane protein assembly factor BamB
MKGEAMKNLWRVTLLVVVVSCALIQISQAQDWPQWRGPNRDAKAAGFKAPKTWPKELTQKWKVAIGEGVATPALVGNKIYTFSREDGNEITRCLDAVTGKEIWQEKYESLGADRPADSFSGPRSSPTVAEGKVVTFGVRGVLSCLDAATGKKLWRKNDFPGAYPRFHPSSSPIAVDGICVAQLGGKGNGAVVAYDLASGTEKWKWTGDDPAYASPVWTTVGGVKVVIAETERKLVALSAADGKLLWEAPFAAQGMGGYNAATPILDGATLIYAGSGRGTKAVKLEKADSGLAAKELWSNSEKSVQFNTPVLKNGLLFGLTQGNELFCLNAQGQTAWDAPVGETAPGSGPPPGRGGGGGRGRGGGRGGYGSIVDAGPVLLALTPSSQLVVFEPDEKAFKPIARYKVADSPTHAYPVASGNRLFIKDRDSLTLWTIE